MPDLAPLAANQLRRVLSVRPQSTYACPSNVPSSRQPGPGTIGPESGMLESGAASASGVAASGSLATAPDELLGAPDVDDVDEPAPEDEPFGAPSRPGS